MFSSEIKVILTIYHDVKYGRPPSWIFSKGDRLWFWVKISNFFKVCCKSKLDLEIKFVDVLGWDWSHSNDIWRCQIWSVAILDFFQWGYPMVLGQNFKFLQSLYIVKLDLEIMFVDVLEWNKLNWFWRYMKMSNLISRLLGFFSKGLT